MATAMEWCAIDRPTCSKVQTCRHIRPCSEVCAGENSRKPVRRTVPNVPSLRIFVMTSPIVSTALYISLVLSAPSVGIGQLVLPQSQEASPWSAAVVAPEPASRFGVAVVSSGCSPVLGLAAAQVARSSSREGKQSRSDHRHDYADINTAGTRDLQRAKGVGPVTVKAIVQDRDANGPYAKLEDFERVKRVGPVTRENIKQAGFCVK